MCEKIFFIHIYIYIRNASDGTFYFRWSKWRVEKLGVVLLKEEFLSKRQKLLVEILNSCGYLWRSDFDKVYDGLLKMVYNVFPALDTTRTLSTVLYSLKTI